MLVSAQALVVTLFGGVGTVWGPVIGAAILVPLAKLLNAELGDYPARHSGRRVRLAIIGMILAAPDGLFWTRARPAASVPQPPGRAPAPRRRPLLPCRRRRAPRPRCCSR